MENQRLAMLKPLIGKEFHHNPSPYGRWLKGTLISAEEGEIVAAFVVREEMVNPGGMLHGGVMAGMIDEVMGVTFFTLGMEYFYPTINLNVDYFAPSRVGDTVNVKVNVAKRGTNIINLKGEATNSEGRVLAQASSNVAKSEVRVPF